jgi:hypothetical protein
MLSSQIDKKKTIEDGFLYINTIIHAKFHWKTPNKSNNLWIGEGAEYRPFHDLRSVPQAGRLSEQVENDGRACTQVLFLRKAELGFFHFLEIVTG